MIQRKRAFVVLPIIGASIVEHQISKQHGYHLAVALIFTVSVLKDLPRRAAETQKGLKFRLSCASVRRRQQSVKRACPHKQSGQGWVLENNNQPAPELQPGSHPRPKSPPKRQVQKEDAKILRPR